ncbi:sodium-coupled monocarboxylate transporter 1-like [Physella acuta]|uniref:sodium-coupled monocarboxylate transporter 1-like n=1 Tax=Physella acuta TaxID=109671 RepID=UPI0027DCB595|nr:sodium-coupled monocarboxylate transporter 1-like [Physella acuta]
MASHYFHIADYVVFGLTIVVSVGIGIYYAFSGGRQKTTSEYLVGGRSMSFIPVAISLLVSFESSIMMLGLPAEAYVYGMQLLMGNIGTLISQLLTIHLVVPLLHPLKITSAYEYLELRFQSRWVRLLGTLMGMLTYVWYMGIVLFGPAVALEAVTGFSLWNSIVTISLVSVIYTSIGGLKAVVWTDVFQAFVMYAGIFSILIKGTIEAGGAKNVWDIAERGGRFNFFNFDPDPRTRHTFFNLFFGSIIRGFGLGFNQSTVQRISSTKTQLEAKKMLLITAPCYLISLAISMYEGVVAYAFYETKKCDPFESKQLADPNQIIPLIVMDIFADLPGMPGLFLASLFSASLSTLSSGLSSLSALLWADVIHPILGPNVSETKATIIAKGSVLLFGIMACGIAILVSQIGGTLTQITGSLLSAFAGPLTGLFFLACFFPRVKARGALIGGAVGLAFSVWLSLGITFSPSKKATPWLPAASTDNCPVGDVTYNVTNTSMAFSYVENVTYVAMTTVSENITTVVKTAREPVGVELMYTISYLWISVLGTFSCILVALVASVFTGMNKPGDVDPRYLISMSGTMLICFPKPVIKFFSSMGPQYMREEFKAKFPDPAAHALVLQTPIEITIDAASEDEDFEDRQTSEKPFLMKSPDNDLSTSSRQRVINENSYNGHSDTDKNNSHNLSTQRTMNGGS